MLYVTLTLLNDEYVNFIYSGNCEMKKYDSNSEGKWKTVEFVGNLSYPAKFMVKFSSKERKICSS